MNAASQILRFLAIIGAIAAGAFFFLTRNKVEDLNSQLATAKSTLAATKTSDAADIAAAKARADKAETDKAALNKQVQDDGARIDAASTLLNEATTSASAAIKEGKTKDAALADKQNQIDDLKKQGASAEELANDNKTLTDRVKELEDIVAKGGTPGTSKSPENPSINVTPGPNGIAVTPTAPALTPSGSVESTTIGPVNVAAGLVVIDTDLPKNTSVMLQAAGTELGRGTILDSPDGHSVVAITSTGEMSVSDFFHIVTEGKKVDYVRLK